MKIRFSKISILSMLLWCVVGIAQVKQIALPNINNPFKTKTQSSKSLQKKVISPAISVVDTTVNPTNRIKTVNGSFMVDLKDLSNPIAKKIQKLKTSNTTKGASTIIDFNSWFNLDTNHSFVLISSKTDELNLTHNYFRQYYKGVSIEGAILMLHTKNDTIYASNGQVAQFEKIEVESKISKDKAVIIAKEHLKVTDLINTYPVESLIAKIPNSISFEYKYVHKVRIDSSNPFVMANVYIDAINGSVLNTVSLVTNCMNTTSEAVNKKNTFLSINLASSKPENIVLADTPSTANTMYSGTQSIVSDSYNGAYRLRDNARNIQTFDATNATGIIPGGLTNAIDYSNNSTTWATFPVLTSFTISTLSQNWWYSAIGDSSPDLYIKVKNASNVVVYDGRNNYRNNTFPSLTFPLYIPLTSQPYIIEIWDYDPVGGDDFGGSYQITSSSGNWSVNGNSGNYNVFASGYNPELDVHWGMEKTYDFYLNVFSRNSYDKNGSVIKNYINPPSPHFAINNAAAYPFPYNFMYYGVGDGERFRPLVGLDIQGHEYSHMVVNYRQNLYTDINDVKNSLNYQGESGALNESFADIFGTCIEFYAKPATANWTIGEDFTLPVGSFARSMSNPILGIQPQPDTYNGLFWYNPNCGTPSESNDKCGVHINSGVQNFWFYLLAQNTSTPTITGTNDLGNQYSVTSIGINKARKIAYRNLTTHLPSYNSTYMDSYYGSLLSAQEIYGANSPEYNSVRQAWYAVGIGNSPNSPCSGITNLTDNSGTFTDGSGLANYNDNANCTWLIKPAGATQISLNFTAFNTEATYDFVSVYNGPDDTYPLLGTYSGNTLPSTISTTAGIGAMYVKFTSDILNTFSGWSADYTSIVTPPTCSGLTILTTPSGTFSDGSGANNYTNNQQCLWYIAPPCATSVTLSFTSFNTELNYDGVAIYDSLTAKTPIAAFTGTSLPTSVTSSTGVMIVAFISDFSTTSLGFSANYTSTGSSFCSGTTTFNTADYGTFSDGSGANNYCNNSNCSWLIQPPNAISVTLNFTAFDLEQASIDGITIYDVVEVYDGTSSSATLLNKFVGNNIPPTVTSTSGSMFIKFTSNISGTYQGWTANYTSTQTPYCNGVATTLTTAAGTLSDGSGADKYANNSNCAWLIQPTNAKTVTLNFTVFDTELNYDGVIVYDGINNTAPVLGKFTGSTLPPSVTSTTGSMYVEFLSDEALRVNGWTANYTSTKPSIYNLTSNNFKLQVESNSCIGKKTGKISATITNTNYAYQVTVSGVNSYTNTQTIPVGTGTWSITGLEKGKYTICFAIVSEPNQKQCFDVEVTEPEPLSVYAKVDNSTGIVNLAMLGANNYTVSVNGKTTSVSSSNFSTILPTGLNSISVTTDKDCQGIYQQEIFISEKAFIYPNPTFGVLHIFVGGTENTISYALTDLSGATIKKSILTVGETREVEVDLSGIPQGNYIININSKTVSQSFKVIKL